MQPTGSQQQRQRLVGVMDSYLRYFIDQAGERPRFSPHFRGTENGIELPLGTGLWRTIRGRRPEGHYFVDVETGHVDFWGVLDELGGEVIYGIRLKVEGTLISEAEAIVTRGGSSYFHPQVVLNQDTTFHEVLPVEERGTRAELIDVVNRYFDAIETQDGTSLPVTDDCRRFVNGTIDSREDPDELEEDERHRELGVADQITAGHFAYIEALRERRFPIVDLERGVAMCHLVFDHPGDLGRANGEYPFDSPNSMLVFEAFKIRRGVLHEVWAVSTNALPYGIRSGWLI